MYSTPKYNAKAVSTITRTAQIRDKESKQKTKCESIKSKQKNHLPKSIKKQFPFSKIK